MSECEVGGQLTQIQSLLFSANQFHVESCKTQNLTFENRLQINACRLTVLCRTAAGDFEIKMVVT